MAKYLRTSSINAELEDLIRNAKEKLFIISPYLKLSEQIRELLSDKNREKVEVKIIFGKQELNPTELEFLEGLPYVRLYFYKNLHAKCYLNENKMIISSMNLYEFSQQNNREMGVLFEISNDEDKSVYDNALTDINSILHNSEDFSVKISKPQKTNKFNAKPKLNSNTYTKLNSNSTEMGYCIRCGKPIKLDPLAPYCKDCYNTWKKFGNEEYPENFCHICGKEAKTSMLKPTCYSCYKSNKDKFVFSL